ncbi:MAG: Methyltransferase type 11 [Gammaproteobacteria bacterium]|nr:Methyltransferase type 11 [Gammaproteobacteria bacterium]
MPLSRCKVSSRLSFLDLEPFRERLRLTLEPEEEDLQDCAFDAMAGTYDATFTDSRVGRALREIVWSRLEHTFRAPQRILELGCGTGEDALRLARSGVHVVATDPSSGMIQVARCKAVNGNCAQHIEFRCVAMEDIGSFPAGEMFDGVLSNFGAVNCVPNLKTLVADLAGRLTPGAPLLWVVMGRYAPWEWLWYLVRGHWRKAWRRLDRGGVEWRGLTISYPTPAQIRAVLRPHFAITRLAPLGVALPPSYAAGWLDRSPRALAVLARLEKLAQRSSALASLSDHFIVEATRLPRQSGHMNTPERVG